MKFYSQSKKRLLDTAEVPVPHLNNLKAKIDRGEYRDINGDVLSVDGEREMLQEIDGELSKRAELAANEGGGQ